jgi:hypothetical protein
MACNSHIGSEIGFDFKIIKSNNKSPNKAAQERRYLQMNAHQIPSSFQSKRARCIDL